MYLISLFNILLIVKVGCDEVTTQKIDTNLPSDKTFVYKKYKYDEVYGVIVNQTTEQILDFYEDNDDFLVFPSRVHISSNDSLKGDDPVFITATAEKGISSWQLPLVVDTGHERLQFSSMARTLCPASSKYEEGRIPLRDPSEIDVTSPIRPTIHISTSHPTNVSVDIKLRRVTDFYVEIDKDIYLNGTTPSTPKYYYFSFANNSWNSSHKAERWLPKFNYSIPQSVLLMIESDDDVCAEISIQNNSCPVFDNEREVLYKGYRFTMTRKGGITLTQSMFPSGFYIVLLVKQSDEVCTGVTEMEYNSMWGETRTARGNLRVKNFRFRAVATITLQEYLVAASVTLAAIMAFGIFTIALGYCSCKWGESVVIEEEIIVSAGPSTSTPNEVCEDAPILQDTDSDSDYEPGIAESTTPAQLTVAALCRSKPEALHKRSDRYFWGILTMALVYALPVVQLLVTYQKMIFETGNQDLCYYNFLCAHPLGQLSDFNHVWSNIGYVIFGLIFIAQVRARQRKEREKEGLGIPLHAPLLYSLGLALIMEGILSACYHLCPNKMNFQFDSSFMYVAAVLVMVRLYHARHADVNARAQTTFLTLAIIMALGVYGIMYSSIYFWVLFTILHLATCLFLTIKIYYVGKLKFAPVIIVSAISAVREHKWLAFRPRYKVRAFLLAIANVLNWALAAHGLYIHSSDFARHVLALLLSNALLHVLFYISMKIYHGERIHIATVVQLILAAVAAGTAGTLFLHSTTKWAETAAHSRTHNAACLALQYYDAHDLWHLVSAVAVYLSLNVLLTVDDALATTPRDRIPVF